MWLNLRKVFTSDPFPKKEPNHYPEHIFFGWIKVSKFQNEFMNSSCLPKYEPNIVRGRS